MSSEIFDLATFAKNLGWADAGIAKAEISDLDQKNYKKWLQNYGGANMRYLEKRQEERFNPKKYFPEVQSILVFAHYYFAGWAKGEIKVSNYAFGPDYHEYLKEKLEATLVELKKLIGGFQYRITVDTAPVMEKNIAVNAGIGWQGKNTLVLNPQYGSQIFLAEVFTDIPSDAFAAKLKMNNHCGTCQKCIEACPTNALEPFILKVDQCISYLTLEHRGDFKQSTPAYQEWIAGCDICQEVCPWNQKLIPLPQDNEGLDNLDVAEMRDPNWLKRIENKALNYVPEKNWERNLRHIGIES